MEEMEASELGERIGLVPILRAGLGMVDAMLELMPTAQVWHLGLFRDERTLRPVEYYNKLPDSATVDLCLILDPMLATGGRRTAAIDVLKRWGAVKPVRIKLVNLIAAPEGVAAVQAAHPDVEIHCAALDRGLNEKGYIIPGSATPATANSETGGSGARLVRDGCGNAMTPTVAKSAGCRGEPAVSGFARSRASLTTHGGGPVSRVHRLGSERSSWRPCWSSSGSSCSGF